MLGKDNDHSFYGGYDSEEKEDDDVIFVFAFALFIDALLPFCDSTDVEDADFAEEAWIGDKHGYGRDCFYKNYYCFFRTFFTNYYCSFLVRVSSVGFYNKSPLLGKRLKM